MELEATFGRFFKIQVILLLIELGQERKIFLLQRRSRKGLSKDDRGNGETHDICWSSNNEMSAEDVNEKEKDRRREWHEIFEASLGAGGKSRGLLLMDGELTRDLEEAEVRVGLRIELARYEVLRSS